MIVKEKKYRSPPRVYRSPTTPRNRPNCYCSALFMLVPLQKKLNMEDQNLPNEETWRTFEKAHRRGKIMGGLLIVSIGSLFLARELGVEMPFWLFSWKMLLIGIGIVLAVKHKFLHPGWIILVAVGGTFLMTDIYPELNIKPILWPILVIMAGLFIIFKPRRKMRNIHMHHRRHWKEWHQHRHSDHARLYQNYMDREEPSKEDYIDSTALMAGVKKIVLSKNFKGGEITNVFGGTELNLTQADFEGKVSLEITQVFGGTKLIVPANWEIKSELAVTAFGSVEDKRAIQPAVTGEPTKVLVITGTTVFGGIDIRSY
jgi:predicted membrane protein